MEKKTIGGFIAALRRSQGLTQQDVAHKLNISNKTVSKWERDESSPDISLIPVIAELFGVTCDEILLGERKIQNNHFSDNDSKKVANLLHHISRTTLNKFKNISLLALLMTVIGLALTFGISYALFKPILGFALGVIFFAGSGVVECIQYNTANVQFNSEDLANESNLFLNATQTLRRWLFAVLNVDLAAFLFSLPLVLVNNEYFTDSVIAWDSYVALFPIFLIIVVVLVIIELAVCGNWLSPKGINRSIFTKSPSLKKLNIQHLVLMGIAWAIPLSSIICDYFWGIELGIFALFVFAGFIIASIIVAILTAIKNVSERKLLICATIRNILIFVASIFAYSGITYMWIALAIIIIATGGYFSVKRVVVVKTDIKYNL
jgi:transcriptional regulator with XRE-family HTH domain